MRDLIVFVIAFLRPEPRGGWDWGQLDDLMTWRGLIAFARGFIQNKTAEQRELERLLDFANGDERPAGTSESVHCRAMGLTEDERRA